MADLPRIGERLKNIYVSGHREVGGVISSNEDPSDKRTSSFEVRGCCVSIPKAAYQIAYVKIRSCMYVTQHGLIITYLTPNVHNTLRLPFLAWNSHLRVETHLVDANIQCWNGKRYPHGSFWMSIKMDGVKWNIFKK